MEIVDSYPGFGSPPIYLKFGVIETVRELDRDIYSGDAFLL